MPSAGSLVPCDLQTAGSGPGCPCRHWSTRPIEAVAKKMIDTDRKPAVHDQVLVEAELDGTLVGLRAVIVNVTPTMDRGA